MSATITMKIEKDTTLQLLVFLWLSSPFPTDVTPPPPPHTHTHTHAYAHTEQCKEIKLVKSDRKKLWITNLLYETWPNKYDIKNIFYLKFIILITNSDYCWKIKVKRVQALILHPQQVTIHRRPTKMSPLFLWPKALTLSSNPWNIHTAQSSLSTCLIGDLSS